MLLRKDKIVWCRDEIYGMGLKECMLYVMIVKFVRLLYGGVVVVIVILELRY